jgi:hypothetical protein
MSERRGCSGLGTFRAVSALLAAATDSATALPKRAGSAAAWVAVVSGWIAFSAFQPARAADLYPTAGPLAAESAMFSGWDILTRLETGTNAPLRSGGFAEPAAAATGAMPTLNDLMAAAPSVEAGGALDGDVMEGKSYWGLFGGAWGLREGTMPTRTLSAANDTLEAGYYSATTLSAVDADLAPENIKQGVSIFGMVGTARFTDHGDGTVTDNLTGLMWTKNAGQGTPPDYYGTTKSWDDAVDHCNSLEVGGYEDWRLPNRFEMESLIDPSVYDGLSEGHPFTDVHTGGSYYWTSTTTASNTNEAWIAQFASSLHFLAEEKHWDYFVWPVRGEP